MNYIVTTANDKIALHEILHDARIKTDSPELLVGGVEDKDGSWIHTIVEKKFCAPVTILKHVGDFKVTNGARAKGMHLKAGTILEDCDELIYVDAHLVGRHKVVGSCTINGETHRWRMPSHLVVPVKEAKCVPDQIVINNTGLGGLPIGTKLTECKQDKDDEDFIVGKASHTGSVWCIAKSKVKPIINDGVQENISVLLKQVIIDLAKLQADIQYIEELNRSYYGN